MEHVAAAGRHHGSRAAVLVAVLAIVLLALAACGGGGSQRSVETTTVTTVPGGASTGVDITVRGEVGRVVDRHLFSVGGDGSGPVLVLWERPAGRLRPGRTVAVTGVVRPSFHVDGLEEELGIDLDDDRAGGFEGEPVLVAAVVTVDG